MKNLTDEEYIEKLKKDEGRRKKHAMLSIFILSLFSAPIIYYSVSIYSQAQELLFNLGSGDTTLENEALSYIEKNEKFILGFGIGSAISAACAFIGISIGLVVTYYFSGRKELMLIKYYELYKNRNA